ncbi:MAG: 23S rRNA pseudouridine(955/2504/2580) synthase RluC [Gammaproteobacteria bacterium]|nr:MAG: 23S rRNA pseudouridine(955/2504/2580) synthase RluC [Gammaproteobacteria bacterium]
MENNKQSHLAVEMVEIDSERAGQRLDNFLITKLKGVPKSRIYKMFRKGEVRVNKGRIKPQYRLVEGDVVRVPPVRVPDQPEKVLSVPYLQDKLEGRILYEDERLLVLNKPSGMAVHGGSGLSYGVIEALRAIRPESRFLELVHRLDKETSGCLVVAKKRSTLRELHELFRGNDVDKRYLALFVGQFVQKYQLVDVPLDKNVRVSGERMVTVSKTGKPSQTEFRLKKSFSEYTLVEAKLRTGRTHQIRVHAAYIDYPLAGDSRYGIDSVNQKLRKNGLKRLFLHSSKISFKLPSSGDFIKVEAPLDDDLAAFLEGLAE